jgi:hypothetical protein
MSLSCCNGFRGPRGKRRFRFHPGMMEELFSHPALRESENPALPLRDGFSMFRDDFPWLYELGSAERSNEEIRRRFSQHEPCA